MRLYKYTVTATRERFMERMLFDTYDYYIIADERDQADTCLGEMIRKGGWNLKRVVCEECLAVDAR